MHWLLIRKMFLKRFLFFDNYLYPFHICTSRKKKILNSNLKYTASFLWISKPLAYFVTHTIPLSVFLTFLCCLVLTVTSSERWIFPHLLWQRYKLIEIILYAFQKFGECSFAQRYTLSHLEVNYCVLR